jgi:hypothetical protein
MNKVWAVWGERDWEGVDLDSIWDNEASAKLRYEEIKKDPRGFGYDDCFCDEWELNQTSFTYHPLPKQEPRHNKSYKDWENK